MEVTEPWLWGALSSAGSFSFTGWFYVTSRSLSQPHPSLMFQLFCRTHWPPQTGTRKQWTGLLAELWIPSLRKNQGSHQCCLILNLVLFALALWGNLDLALHSWGPLEVFQRSNSFFFIYSPVLSELQIPNEPLCLQLFPCANLPPHCSCSSGCTQPFKGLLPVILPLIAGPQEQ